MSTLSDPAFWIQNALLIIAFIPLYIQWWNDRKKSKTIDVELEKGYEASNQPVNSLYRVTILHPSKTIEHCKVFLDNTPLPFNERSASPVYDRKIPQMSGATVRVPEEVRRDDAWVIVKSGEDEIKRQKFREIPYDSTGLPPRN